MAGTESSDLTNASAEEGEQDQPGRCGHMNLQITRDLGTATPKCRVPWIRGFVGEPQDQAVKLRGGGV